MTRSEVDRETKRGRLPKVALATAMGTGLVGAGVAGPALPASAHCPGSYVMNHLKAPGWYDGVVVYKSGCHGADVAFGHVSRSTNYRAYYQNANGQWVNASVNSQNGGDGPFLTAGAQNPWKKMITNLPNGRGMWFESQGTATVDIHG